MTVDIFAMQQNCRQRKILDGINTMIYEPIQSDGTVICVGIMSVIMMANEKDLILNLCKLIICFRKKLNGLINGHPPSLTQNYCLLVMKFIAEHSPRLVNDGLRLATKLQDERG